MQPGWPVSIVLNSAILCWALLSFAAAPPPMEAPPSDPIDVELLPPTATSQQKQGDTKGKPSDQITKETKASAKESDGKRVGDTKTEEPPPPPPEAEPTPPQEAKPTLPQEKPQPVAAVPPPPKPPEVKPEPPKPDLSKLAKVEPVPVPPAKPDLPIEGDKAKTVGEGKPPEVKPQPPKEPQKDEKALDKLLEQAKKADAKPPEKPADKPVEKKPDVKAPDKPAQKSEPVKVAAVNPSQTKPSTTPSNLRGETTDIRNRVETGTAASRAPQHASLGTPNGPATPNVKLSQSELEAMEGALRSQITPCWNPPAGASESGVRVIVDIALNQDGTLRDVGVHLVQPQSSPLGPSIANSAIRAVKMCAAEHPFKLPADKYGAWALNTVTFDPSRQ